MSLHIGIDVGTTNVKTCIFDEKGELLATVSHITPVDHTEYGDLLNARQLWTIVKSSIKEVTTKCKGTELKSIGITSMGETIIPVDRNGPLWEGIMWYNPVTKTQYEQIIDNINDRRIRELTGLTSSWFFSASKIKYIKELLPEIYERVEAFLDVSGFIAFMLTGNMKMDRTFASRLMLLDLKTGLWLDELIEASNIDRSKLPELVWNNEPAGNLKVELIKEFGLDNSVSVTTAGQDHIAAAYAAGIVKQEQVLCSIGTSGAVFACADFNTLKSSRFIENQFFSAGFHVLKGKYYLLEGTPTGGYCIDWFLKQVLNKNYDWLNNITLNKNDVIFYPHLRNTLHGAALGKIINLSDKENADTLMQAIMEGVAFEVKRFIDRLVYIKSDQEVTEFVAVGGATSNNIFMKILANVLGKPIKALEQAEFATNLGAAMISAVAINEITNNYVLESVRKFKNTFYPDEGDIRMYYLEKYKKYLENER
ncbi:MAG: FGGY-family carbohydrate kinase [Petrotogales bacterium]